MKTLADVRAFLSKRYENQNASWLIEQGAWPLTMRLAPPTDKEVLADLSGARAWLEVWRGYDGPGVLEWETRAWAGMGTHSVPVRLIYGGAEMVAKEIGLAEQWRLIRERYESLCARWPVLRGHAVAARHFRLLLDLGDADFARLVHLLQWVVANPRSDCYLRELPVEGLHTKWLESKRALVRDMAVALGVFAPDCEDLEAGLGLKRKPRRIRLRILCPSMRARCMGLEDIELPIKHVAQLPLQPVTLLIVENQETGLALPDLAGTVAIFGLGYGVSVVKDLPWIKSAEQVLYWGDIDTHGFAILAGARAIRRDIASILMDMQVWSAHIQQAAYESRGAGRVELSLLNADERTMLGHLNSFALGPTNRLEQERLPWATCMPRVQEMVIAAQQKSDLPVDVNGMGSAAA